MTLPEICIRRPVLATVINLMVLLMGIIAYTRLTVREYPAIDEPVVTVTTTYRGASAEIIETQVTKILEEGLSGIEGIDVMTSISREETSQITLKFKLNIDANEAAANVRDRIGRSRGQLPDEVDEPVIAKTEADAQPIIWIGLNSSNNDLVALSDYADRNIKDQLSTIPGVASVILFAERRIAMRIWLDPLKLAGFNMTPLDVQNALRQQNIEVPAGRIESNTREFSVVARTDLQTTDQFEDLILRRDGASLVRLRDVGRAAIGARDERSIARYNGKPAVALGIIKQSVANPLDISREAHRLLPDITANLPAGMSISIAYDSSKFIAASIHNVFSSILEAVVLVVLIILVFLRSFRATFIPLITIPISLIGAFSFMWALGYSINTLTLLALALAVGNVVDDAIVMMENITRYIEEGMEPIAAALKGAKEIVFAVIATSVVLVAVYIPVSLQTGRSGKLFTEFAMTLVGAVIVSTLVALTLTPMLTPRIVKRQSDNNMVARGLAQAVVWLTNAYRHSLAVAFRVRPLIVLMGIAAGAMCVVLLKLIPSELAPTEDRGVVFLVGIAPEGTSIPQMGRYAENIEAIYTNLDGVKEYVADNFIAAGFPTTTQLFAPLLLKDWGERPKQQQLAGLLGGPLFGGLPGMLAFAVNPPSLGQSFISRPIEFVVQTSESYDVLNSQMGLLQAEIAKNPKIQNLDIDLKLTKPELRLQVNRERAAALGIEVGDIGRALQTLLGGSQTTRFKYNGKQYDVMVQIEDSKRRTPEQLDVIHLRTETGQMVPLSALVTVSEGIAPKELNHFNKLRSATLTATLAPGYTQSEALAFINQTAKSVLKSGMTTDLGGQSREFRDSAQGGGLVFILALLVIFLVLAAQFESFIDPLVIMTTVPLSMAGALLALWGLGISLNVYSQIGLISLAGMIAKQGILVVEFARQLQEQGRNVHDAVIEASVLRLRPILMTTFAAVFGALPLAFGHGAGAEGRQAIGWVTVAGLSLGALLSLYVVPVIFSYVAGKHGRHEVAA